MAASCSIKPDSCRSDSASSLSVRGSAPRFSCNSAMTGTRSATDVLGAGEQLSWVNYAASAVNSRDLVACPPYRLGCAQLRREGEIVLIKLIPISLVLALAAGLTSFSSPPVKVAVDGNSDPIEVVDVPALPDALSNQEMAELTDESAAPRIVFDETPQETEDRLENLDLDPGHSATVAAVTTRLRAGMTQTADFRVQGRPEAATCYLVPGNMWFRKSSRYGGIGSKPALRSCSPDVVKTGMASEVFRQEWWGWAKVAGPFNSWGRGNMQSIQVTYYCNGKTRDNRFQVITTAWGTTGRGQTGVGRDSTGSYTFRCD